MKPRIVSALVASDVGLVLATSVAAQANGEPKRSSDIPPGIQKLLSKEIPGIAKAIIASEGSNSRLQDIPVSP